MPQIFKHYLNPLHIYCRLMDIGIDKNKSIKIGKLYEKWIWTKILWIIKKIGGLK